MIATVIICDRCGKYRRNIGAVPESWKQEVIKTSEGIIQSDLCPQCVLEWKNKIENQLPKYES